MGVISSSIGSAAGVYCLVAITGYLTFGNDIASNIVGQCKFYIESYSTPWPHADTF